MTSNNETPGTGNPSMALARRDVDAPHAIVPTTIQEAMSLSAELAKSSLIAAEYRQKHADVLHIVLAGQELGLPPMASLRNFYVEKGLPKLTADGVVAVVMARRDLCRSFRLIQSTDKIAEFETVRNEPDGPAKTRLTYSIETARGAGLITKPNWKADTPAMLRARCKAQLARLVYPDIVAGVKTVEEDDDVPDAPYVAPPPGKASAASVAAAQTAAESKAASKRATAAKAKEPPSDVIDAEYVEQKTLAVEEPRPTPPPAAADPEPEPAPTAADDGSDASASTDDFGEPQPSEPDPIDADFVRFKSDVRSIKNGAAALLDLAKVKEAWLPWSKRDEVKARGYHLQMRDLFAARKAELS